LAADFHGKFCSPYAMQWVIDTRSLAAGTAQAVVKRGGDSWFFITDDYAFGHALERDASPCHLNGGKVLVRYGRRLRPLIIVLVLQPRPPRPRSSARRSAQQHERDQDRRRFGVSKGGQQMATLLR
jgi:branched-chain amino acid transport system substrate-binding protein